MSQNGSFLEVAAMQVAAEIVEVLMALILLKALNQIGRVDRLRMSSREQFV